MRIQDDDLGDLRAALRADAPAVAEALLGPPNKALSSRSEWRWGSKGSLALELQGPKRGQWFDHEAGEGGGLLDLIQREKRCNFVDALAWARNWTGADPDGGSVPAMPRPAVPAPENDGTVDADEAATLAQRIKAAQHIASACVPLGGTAGERYLVETRGIPAPAISWPDAIRWHPGHRAVVAVATTADGTIQAVQRIHLTADGQKVGKDEVERRRLVAVKASRGVMDGAAVRLPGDPAGPLLLAEGPETGLSVWAATGHETWIALGSIAKLVLPAGRRIVVCRDDDPRFSPADKKLVKTLREWREQGFKAVVALPWPKRRGDKSDFNDALRADGIEAVRQRIQNALQPAASTRQRLPVHLARERLGAAVSAFFAPVRAGAAAAAAPTVHAIKADVGTGKSRAVHGEAIRALTEMRVRGDERAGVIAVPTIELADKQAAEIRASAGGLRVAVYRGRKQPDPDAPDWAMCRDLEAIADARKAGASSSYDAVCRRKGDDGKVTACRFYGLCGDSKQRRREADLWLVAHELVFGAMPQAIGEVAFLVVDESIHAKGLIGAGAHPMVLSLDTLSHPPGVDMAVVKGYRDRLVQALATQPFDAVPTPVPASALRCITKAEAEHARDLEGRRIIEPAIYPGMPPAARKAAVEAVTRGNAVIKRLLSAWRAVEAAADLGDDEGSGWLATCLRHTEDGPVKVLRIKGHEGIRKGWRVPTLLIDANLNVDLVRPYWPQVELVADIGAETPQMRVRQVVDRAYSLSAFKPGASDPAEEKRRAKNLRRLHAAILREVRRFRGKTLVVAQKAIEDALPGVGPMPASVEMAHHNAIAGRNDWAEVSALIVVGRTTPSPETVEQMAEALTGRAVEHVEGWYPKAPAAREMADGSAEQAEVDRHPDATAEALRWQIAEGELVQIIGRVRGVNRTERDPVDVLVLTDALLPLPVARVEHTDGLLVGPVDLMAARGVVLFNATDAAAAYPEMWTAVAAKQAIMRQRADPDGIKPLVEVPYRGLIPSGFRLGQVEYQLLGPRLSPATAWYDPALVPEPAAWLMEQLGPLAWCEVAPPSFPPQRHGSSGPAASLGAVPSNSHVTNGGIAGWGGGIAALVTPPLPGLYRGIGAFLLQPATLTA